MSLLPSFFKKSEPSFETLIRKEQEKLYRIAYSYVKNEQDALDIVQDTIVKGLKSFSRLKEKNYFSTWITRILINTALDYLRKNNDLIFLEPERINMGRNEENQTILTMDMEIIFDQLKPPQKTLLLLRFYDGYSVPEIAKILDKPEGTIKSQLHRTLLVMRTKLEAGGETYGKDSKRFKEYGR